MPDRPKPPEGDSWIERCLTELDRHAVALDGYVCDETPYARAELEELRNELAVFKALATCNCPDCMAKRRELKAAADRALRVIEDVFG